MDSKIRWKKGDYITLGKSIAQFNKKRDELEKLIDNNYLPEKINYKQLKNTILSRKQLNSTLNDLKAFLKEGAEELVETKSGEVLTSWEYNKLQKQVRQGTANLKKELLKLEQPISSGYSRAQMGSAEYSQILAQLRNLQKLDLKRGYEFKRLKDRLSQVGNLDYSLIKAQIYRENIMKALKESAVGYQGYDLLMKKLNRIRNSLRFYDYIQKSTALSDIFLYYKEGEGLQYGAFTSEQDRFDYALEELGILEEEKQKLIRKFTRNGNKQLLEKAQNISTMEDLYTFYK